MSCRIAVTGDLHYSGDRNVTRPERKSEYALELFTRFIRFYEIAGWPDAVLITGDLLDPIGAADHNAEARHQELAALCAKIPVPWAVLPGDHDAHHEFFYRHLPRPAEFIEVKGCRIVPFPADEILAGQQPFRPAAELLRLERARAGFNGPLIALQHMPLFPEGAAPSCSCVNYRNSAEILNAMHRTGCTLSISGHYHAGFAPVSDGACCCMAVPALCESPFSWQEITLENDGKIRLETRSLRLPDGHKWIDCHTHSPLAYCSQNMNFQREKELMDLFNLSGAAVTEHSGQLFFTPEDFGKNWRWYEEGMNSPRRIDRTGAYLEYFKNEADERFFFGLELDISRHGEIMAPPELVAQLQLRLGATHRLTPDLPEAESVAELLSLIDAHGRQGAQILAHPTRYLTARGIDPHPYFDSIIALLRKHNMAAEINFHHKSADPEFGLAALRAGLKLSFGTDSHNLASFGFLQPHIHLLRSNGYDGDFDDILYTPQKR